LDVFCAVIDIISVCGSIPLEIPILWPRAAMVGPRPRVLLTLPLKITAAHSRHTHVYLTLNSNRVTNKILTMVPGFSYSTGKVIG